MKIYEVIPLHKRPLTPQQSMIKSFVKNVEMYKDVIAGDSKFTILFNVFAETELEAKKIAIKIYESEFGLGSNVIAQQNIEDTNALSVYKCVDEETTLSF